MLSNIWNIIIETESKTQLLTMSSEKEPLLEVQFCCFQTVKVKVSSSAFMTSETSPWKSSLKTLTLKITLP